MKEIGTDPYTYKRNSRALVLLGWIKSHTAQTITLTDKDLTGD